MDRRENFPRTSLRLPQDLYDQLVESAADKRSLNAEIISRLEQTFSEDALFPNILQEYNATREHNGKLRQQINEMQARIDELTSAPSQSEGLNLEPNFQASLSEALAKALGNISIVTKDGETVRLEVKPAEATWKKSSDE